MEFNSLLLTVLNNDTFRIFRICRRPGNNLHIFLLKTVKYVQSFNSLFHSILLRLSQHPKPYLQRNIILQQKGNGNQSLSFRFLDYYNLMTNDLKWDSFHGFAFGLQTVVSKHLPCFWAWQHTEFFLMIVYHNTHLVR